MQQDPNILLIRPVLNQSKYGPQRAFFEALSFSLGLVVKGIASDTNYSIIDLPGPSATRCAFEDALTRYPNIEVIVFLGHGHADGDRAMGHDGKIIIDKSNIRCGEGRGLYFVCCHAAGALGEAAASVGARYFIGFCNKIHLVAHGTEWIVSHCVISGLAALLNGATPMDALGMMEVEFQKWIDTLETKQTDIDPEWFVAAAVLRANLAAIRLCLPGAE